ncbi:hypothetical protein NIES2100_05100 [Calothrix sp. NIES-2100]|nr:hypothetical protein NIES2100_05100 [Calothrix sp. NIES-2100]
MSKQSEKDNIPKQCQTCDYHYDNPRDYAKCAVLRDTQSDFEPCDVRQPKKQS